MRTLPKQVIRCSASCTHFQISSFHFNNRGWVEQGYIIQAEDFTSVALQRRLLRSNTFEMNEALKKAMQKPLVVGVRGGRNSRVRQIFTRRACLPLRSPTGVRRHHHHDIDNVLQGIMPAEVETEVLDIVTAAVDKWISTENYEVSMHTREIWAEPLSYAFCC